MVSLAYMCLSYSIIVQNRGRGQGRNQETGNQEAGARAESMACPPWLAQPTFFYSTQYHFSMRLHSQTVRWTLL